MPLVDLATMSRRHFFFFVEKCNQTYRSGRDLASYRQLITMHRQCGGLVELIDDERFHGLLYRTLEEWDMNRRGAKLASFADFKKSICQYKDDLCKVYEFKIYDDIYDDLTSIKAIINKIFCNLNVMKSRRKIVGVSKVLHFLLPDLIMPIDSKYTMNAFYGYNKYSNIPNSEFITFWEIMYSAYEITERLNLRPEDANGEVWRMSVPKLIDNAIIGLFNCKSEEVLALCKT